MLMFRCAGIQCKRNAQRTKVQDSILLFPSSKQPNMTLLDLRVISELELNGCRPIFLPEQDALV